MGKFGVYFESIVSLKPEWRRAYIDYHALNKLIGEVKKGVKATGIEAFTDHAVAMAADHQGVVGEGGRHGRGGDDDRRQSHALGIQDDQRCSSADGSNYQELDTDRRISSSIPMREEDNSGGGYGSTSSPKPIMGSPKPIMGSPMWSVENSTPPLAALPMLGTPPLASQHAGPVSPSSHRSGNNTKNPTTSKRFMKAPPSKENGGAGGVKVDDDDDEDESLYVNLREDSALFDSTLPTDYNHSSSQRQREEEDGLAIFERRISQVAPHGDHLHHHPTHNVQDGGLSSEATPFLPPSTATTKQQQQKSHNNNKKHRMHILDKGLSQKVDTGVTECGGGDLNGSGGCGGSPSYIDNQNATFGISTERKQSLPFDSTAAFTPKSPSMKVSKIVSRNDSKLNFVNVNKFGSGGSNASPNSSSINNNVNESSQQSGGSGQYSGRRHSEASVMSMPAGASRVRLPAHKEFGIDFRDVKVVSSNSRFQGGDKSSKNQLANEERNEEDGDGGAVSSGLRPVVQITASDDNANQLELTVTDVAIRAAERFETMLLEETNKATHFASDALRKYLDYYDRHIERWKSETHNQKRAKDNIRYIFTEVLQMIQFIETNVLCIKTSLKKYLNSHPFYVREDICEECLIPPLRKVRDKGEALKTLISALWVEIFEDGHASKGGMLGGQGGRGSLMGGGPSPTQAFRTGALTCLLLCLFLYWLHIVYELGFSPSTQEAFNVSFPVGRFALAISWVLVCWGCVLYVLTHANINYLFIFDFPVTSSVGWLQCIEFGLLLMCMSCFAMILYVRSRVQYEVGYYSSAHGFPEVSPYILPIMLAIFVGLIVRPPRHVMRKSRKVFFKVLWKCICLPFVHVNFVDFYVADWGTSTSATCADFLYILCYFTALPSKDYGGNDDGVCLDVQSHYGKIVAMIPFYWRTWQTLLMYRRTKNRAHIVNHFKYWSSLTAMVFEALSASYPNNGAITVITWITHIFSQLYCFGWDILMDWGWIRGKNREMIFRRKWIYVVAGIFDFFARTFFIIVQLKLKKEMGANYAVLMQMMLEILRRAVWSVFRIENENVNNLETYRKIDFVPTVAIEES